MKLLDGVLLAADDSKTVAEFYSELMKTPYSILQQPDNQGEELIGKNSTQQMKALAELFSQKSTDMETYSLMHPHGFQIIISPTGVDKTSQQPSKEIQRKSLPNTIGIRHLCLVAPWSSPLIAEKLKNSGCNLLNRGGTPGTLPGSEFFYLYARDPENNMFEVEQPQHEGLIPKDKIGHISLTSPNIDGLIEFYTAFLGEAPFGTLHGKDIPGMDHVIDHENTELRMAWITMGNRKIEFVEYINPKSIPLSETLSKTPLEIENSGYHSFIISTTDFDEDYALLLKLQTSIIKPPNPKSDTKENSLRSLIFRDPDLNIIFLKEIHKERVNG